MTDAAGEWSWILWLAIAAYLIGREAVFQKRRKP